MNAVVLLCWEFLFHDVLCAYRREVREFFLLEHHKSVSDDSGVSDTCDSRETQSDSEYLSHPSSASPELKLSMKGNINLGPSERPRVNPLHHYTIIQLTLSPHFRLKPHDFEFLRVLGRGSFGKVLLARRYADQRLYAVKVLEKRAVVRRNETQHIMAERNVLRRNQHHTFLVSLHFSFQTEEKLYFVLDFVNGGEVYCTQPNLTIMQKTS